MDNPDKARCYNEPELIDYVTSCGLTLRDAEYLWNKWESNAWTIGGKKLKDWKAAVRAWKAAGYFPSQKMNAPLQRRKEVVGGDAYKPIPPRREVSDKAWKSVADLARREVEKLRATLKP